jgi:hypothetical protein
MSLMQVSRVLKILHTASVNAGKYGPAWLPCECTLIEGQHQFILGNSSLSEVTR